MKFLKNTNTYQVAIPSSAIKTVKSTKFLPLTAYS